jgi:hypothetical protein
MKGERNMNDVPPDPVLFEIRHRVTSSLEGNG